MFHFVDISAGRGALASMWIASFVLAGFMWIAILSVLSPCFGGRRAHFSLALGRAGASAIPLLSGGLWLCYAAGQTRSGWLWSRMMDIALGRGTMQPWAHLNWLFLGLALLSFVIQARLFMTAFDVKGMKALQHLVTGLVIPIWSISWKAVMPCSASGAAPAMKMTGVSDV